MDTMMQEIPLSDQEEAGILEKEAEIITAFEQVVDKIGEIKSENLELWAVLFLQVLELRYSDSSKFESALSSLSKEIQVRLEFKVW